MPPEDTTNALTPDPAAPVSPEPQNGDLRDSSSPTPSTVAEGSNGTPQPLEASPSTPSNAPAQTLVSEVVGETALPALNPQTGPRAYLAKALLAIQFRKKAKLEKVLKFALEKKSITNDQVEKLLRVSDATATRYLAQLTKNGSLRKVGPDGRARYEPLSGSNGGN